MKAKILTPDELTEAEVDALRDQGEEMEDWDYMILAPVDTLALEESGALWQTNYDLNRLLLGYGNRWRKVTFRGQECAVGVCYH